MRLLKKMDVVLYFGHKIFVNMKYEKLAKIIADPLGLSNGEENRLIFFPSARQGQV
jgi:hypothetical protein